MILITNMGCYSSTHLTRISTPRFLGKKRGKVTTVFNDLQKLTMIFFLEGKREQLWKDGSSRRSSIPWSTHGNRVS
jgi:hypothetical protein